MARMDETLFHMTYILDIMSSERVEKMKKKKSDWSFLDPWEWIKYYSCNSWISQELTISSSHTHNHMWHWTKADLYLPYIWFILLYSSCYNLKCKCFYLFPLYIPLSQDKIHNLSRLLKMNFRFCFVSLWLMYCMHYMVQAFMEICVVHGSWSVSLQ